MKSEDLRKEKRIPAADLPEKYKYFEVFLANEVIDNARTVNASLSGFGFESTADPSNFIVGEKIVMYPLNTDKPVYGKVVFTKQNHGSVRVGVKLEEFGGYPIYRRELLSIMNNVNLRLSTDNK